MKIRRHYFVFASYALGGILVPVLAVGLIVSMPAQNPVQQKSSQAPAAVLVELFTSEGCSDCPPADELLRQMNGHKTAAGQLIVGMSEHVNYWDRLGWKDPFSSDSSTERQSAYGNRFALDSVYTPQMVVNGREQFVGSDRRALDAALATETQRHQISLRIDSTKVTETTIAFSYSASDLPAKISLQLVAGVADDTDRSSVARGENSGRELIHVAVVRELASLGPMQAGGQHSVTLPLPPSYRSNPGAGHHLVVFAQQGAAGAVMGVDTKPL